MKGELTFNIFPDNTEMEWHQDSLTVTQREALGRPADWCTRVGRKVTAVLLLRHARRGGLMQIRGSDYDDRETEPGDVLVFRSDDLHRVTMAEEGGRVSALASYG